MAIGIQFPSLKAQVLRTKLHYKNDLLAVTDARFTPGPACQEPPCPALDSAALLQLRDLSGVRGGGTVGSAALHSMRSSCVDWRTSTRLRRSAFWALASASCRCEHCLTSRRSRKALKSSSTRAMPAAEPSLQESNQVELQHQHGKHYLTSPH